MSEHCEVCGTELVDSPYRTCQNCFERAHPERRAEDSFLDEIPDRPLHYDRRGLPISLRRWSELMEDHEYRVIARTEINDKLVSTVWLGLDASPFGPPMIFETMVFDAAASSRGQHDDLTMHRYTTEAAARRGHDAIAKVVRYLEDNHGEGTDPPASTTW